LSFTFFKGAGGPAVSVIAAVLFLYLGRRRSYREIKGIDMITWTNYEALSDPQHAGWGLNQKGKKY